jgi:hypothetical protein
LISGLRLKPVQDDRNDNYFDTPKLPIFSCCVCNAMDIHFHTINYQPDIHESVKGYVPCSPSAPSRYDLQENLSMLRADKFDRGRDRGFFDVGFLHHNVHTVRPVQDSLRYII